MLARLIEAAGIATTLITPMPFWAEKIGTPRTLAVEHPFGQTLGRPFDVQTQTKILLSALHLLADAAAASTIIHSDSIWPLSTKETMRAWQPQEPSPIVAEMGSAVRERLRQLRKSAAG